MGEFSRTLINHPELIPYFYENRSPPTKHKPSKHHPDDGDLSRKLDLACEMIMDFADSLIEQRMTARPDSTMDWATWDAYFRFLYTNSRVLRDYIPDNHDFYPDYELVSFGYIVVRDPVTGQILRSWDAREIDLGRKSDRALANRLFGLPLPGYIGLRGYPWVRTWVLEPVGSSPDDSVMVAAVEVPQATFARVHSRTYGLTAMVDAPDLHSWVLGTLATSTLIDTVDVHTGPTPPARFDLRGKPPRRPTREPYAAPRFTPR